MPRRMPGRSEPNGSAAATDSPAILADAERVRHVSWDTLSPELSEARMVCNHFEVVGTFIRLGNVDADVACQLCALIVTQCWHAVAPVIALLQERLGANGIWENLQYLAVLSDDYLQLHRGQNYPAEARRMPVDSSLIDTLAAGTASANSSTI